jgi:hypothetical protein
LFDFIVGQRDRDPAAATTVFLRRLVCRNPRLLIAELALECAPAYYRYGAALLYQAQDSADVFGTSMKGAAGEEEEEEEQSGAGVLGPRRPSVMLQHLCCPLALRRETISAALGTLSLVCG